MGSRSSTHEVSNSRITQVSLHLVVIMVPWYVLYLLRAIASVHKIVLAPYHLLARNRVHHYRETKYGTSPLYARNSAGLCMYSIVHHCIRRVEHKVIWAYDKSANRGCNLKLQYGSLTTHRSYGAHGAVTSIDSSVTRWYWLLHCDRVRKRTHASRRINNCRVKHLWVSTRLPVL